MSALKAHVRHGRLVLDEPTELPEGAVVELVVVGGVDELDEESRARLGEALDEALADADHDVDAADLIAELRARG